MLGRLPWFAFERRSRALRFLVFFDIGPTRYDAPTANPTEGAAPSACHAAPPRLAGSLLVTTVGT